MSAELEKIKIVMLKGEKGDAGQDGDAGDYSGLANKPSINGVTLAGNMTGDDLNLVQQSQVYTKDDFIKIEGEISIEAHSYKSAQIDLSEYGITNADIANGNWVVLAVYQYGTGAYQSYSMIYENQLYPRANLYASLGSTLTVSLINTSNSASVVKYRVILMRWS